MQKNPSLEPEKGKSLPDNQRGQLPRYGEVWLLDPVEECGKEVGRASRSSTKRVERPERDRRPVVIISSDALGIVPRRVVAGIDQKNSKGDLWRIPFPSDIGAGFDSGVVDTLQLSTVETSACVERLGRLPADCMAEVAAAIAILVEYEE